MTTRTASEAVTEGIHITVQPEFLARESAPAENRYIFAYKVRIANHGEERARLQSRHWIIVDADGRRHDVRGEGVVGHNPDLGPGETFEYASYCPLETPWGTMEGAFLMQRPAGGTFPARIARFFLISRVEEPATAAR